MIFFYFEYNYKKISFMNSQLPNDVTIKIIDIKLIGEKRIKLPLNCNECTICRCNINDIISDNNQNNMYISKHNHESIIIIGTCNHAFHKQCINNWILSNNICPVCSCEWVVSKKITI